MQSEYRSCCFGKRVAVLNIASVALVLFTVPVVAVRALPAKTSQPTQSPLPAKTSQPTQSPLPAKAPLPTQSSTASKLSPAANRVTAESKPAKGWLLVQKSQGAGECKIWLTPTAARLESTRGGYGLLIIGNDPKLYEFNCRKKIYFRADTDQWKPVSVGEFLLRDGNFEDLQFKGSKDEQEFGTALRHQTLAVDEVFHGAPNHKAEKLTVVGADLWVTKSIPFPKSVLPIIQRMYALPKCIGFPVRFEYVNRKAKQHVEMETTTFQRVTISADRMSMPADYKQVHSRNEVFINPEGEETLKDMLLE
jgi:hypothetical protein